MGDRATGRVTGRFFRVGMGLRPTHRDESGCPSERSEESLQLFSVLTNYRGSSLRSE